MRLGLRRAAYGEPDADAFHGMLGAAENLRSASGVPQCRGALARSAGRRLNAASGEFLSITPAGFLKRGYFSARWAAQLTASRVRTAHGLPGAAVAWGRKEQPVSLQRIAMSPRYRV
jgi:hypothetical protein